MSRYAQVIVSVAARSIDRPFTYAIPDDEEFFALAIGWLVGVPFGKRNVPGFVVGISDTPPEHDGTIKPLECIVNGPHFASEAVALARWMSRYYASPLANCLNLFTPALGKNWRTPPKHRARKDTELPATTAPRHEQLTDGQQQALTAIEQLGAGETLLLDGITGSGKTEVYMRATEDALARGEGVVVLVPEIALTPQTVGRFRARFGDTVAVLHSRLTPAQRGLALQALREGEKRMVVGPRSALFAPVHNLKLIVIDEEHDHSYKQESDPRYHAVRVAREMAALYGARLILGSATPSFTTLALVNEGHIGCTELPERVNRAPLPHVEVIDMTAEFDAGNRSIFSRALLAGLEEVRANRRKAILLMNRRGFAPFMLCRECGYVPMCPSCETSLTLHASHGMLQCHYCGHLEPEPAACPRCASPYIASFGAGTQRVEHEFAKLFEDWPLVRMDADTTAGRTGHADRLAEFEVLETGVLVGTQMVAKGLDYPEVTLVGILAADSSLTIPEYTAPEQTYQLLEQVAGRAGRGEDSGAVIIQTYQPEHLAIRAAAEHDRTILLGADLEVRNRLGYPPYVTLCDIVISSLDEEKASIAAEQVGECVRARCGNATGDGSMTILGPVACVLSRLKGRHRYHVLVKAPRGSAVGEIVTEVLATVKLPREVRVTVDIDPVSVR